MNWRIGFSSGERRLHVRFAAIMLAAIAFATLASGQSFSAWSQAVSVGTVVNSTGYDACPFISKNGLDLYFRSNRAGQGRFDIYVSHRDSQDDPWEAPVNLGPAINGPYNQYCSVVSNDGHWLYFVSDRPGCGGLDIWVAHRQNKRDDQGWETPKNLGCNVNSAWNDNGPNLLEDDAGGQSVLYFSSNRPGGPGGVDIYSSPMYDKDSFGPPSLVPGLNTSATEQQPTLSKNGLEIIFVSNRAGGSGGADLWVATRATVYAPWSLPVNL